MNTLDLFFDDTRLFRRNGFCREYTVPEEAAVFVDGTMNTCLPSGFVLTQPDGTFRMIYAGTELENGKHHFLTAVSSDGIHFEKDNTAAAAAGIKEPAAPNQIIEDLPKSSEIVTVFEDPMAEPEARYKMLTAIFCSKELRLYNRLMISSDTLHWKLVPTVLWHSRGTEPVGSCCYDSARDRWLIACRPDWGDRRVAGIWTKDWETFTPPKLLLHPDSLDEELVEFYGMCVADCGGYMIGLLDCYNPGNKEALAHKFTGGKVSCELVYSRDGENWQRTLRKPFAGEEYTMFYPSTIRCDENYHYIYASATDREHGDFTPKELSSAIRVYRTPKNRFIALSASGEPGTLALRECVWNGGKLLWNLKAEKATVAIYDLTGEQKAIVSHEDCIPFSGDSIAWEPQWKNRKDLEDLKGRLLVFELRLENGSVWSVSGDYRLLGTTEAFRFRQSGIVPTRKGF